MHLLHATDKLLIQFECCPSISKIFHWSLCWIQKSITMLLIYFQMKHEKVFVKYRNFNENQSQNRDRQAKKPAGDRKKYAEKSNKVRQAVRQIIDSYEPLEQTPTHLKSLLNKFPKFFNEKTTPPEKDTNQFLNEVVIINAKRYIESLTNNKKQFEQAQSSSDPDWNSDDEIEGNMKSKEIEVAVKEKIAEKYGDQSIKKEILKRHEKEFLEDYFRTKRLQQQQEIESNAIENAKNPIQKGESSTNNNKAPRSNEKITDPTPSNQETNKNSIKQKNIWSQYQQKQVNSFVDMGFMTKVNENEEEIEAELAQDDGMFCDDEEVEEEQKQVKSESDSQGDDDIFGDQHPTTTVKAAKPNDSKVQSEKTITQGTVVINTRLFSRIAESVGLHPASCNWIISNEKQKYKVSTQYMNIYYRSEKINEILPYVSLNHSQYVRNEEVETEKAREIFQKYNARRDKKYQYNQNRGGRYQYKEKAVPHHKK